MAPLTDILREFWGYDTFLPLQEEAMKCVLEGRDSVVILPTGGGKSLCFQAPVMAMDGMAVVVSPLISLMKDQVDTLRSNGIPAASINSAITDEERYHIDEQIRSGSLKLLYVSPERLITPQFVNYLKETKIAFIAVDEAHCISAWGHDFRPEYRGLGDLKSVFPDIGVHGYTATATEQVRQDIVQELALDAPEVLVGSFDRPNLVYKVERCASENERISKVIEIVNRHPNESGIVYCIRRKDVDALAAVLKREGHSVRPYHAGMNDGDRMANQEAFIQDDADIVVATVAFGMGIDKPNVRYVIHAGMPKSLEHYQQESGRAGRDGLEAECHLLFTGKDFATWRFILGDADSEGGEIALAKLSEIQGFCTGVTCRHRALVTYFGQTYEKDNCGACDVCLGEVEQVEGALEIAQKIISCVVRLNEFYGAAYTTKVLSGSREKRILDQGHDQLSTYGILSNFDGRAIRDWIEQLVSQGFLDKTGEFNVLNVPTRGRGVLRGHEQPVLLKPSARKKAAVATESWAAVDRDLFETLRALRREFAHERSVPAYVIFGDNALRDMARIRPTSKHAFLTVSGVGKKKNQEFGKEFRHAIVEYCETKGLETDIGVLPPRPIRYPTAESEPKTDPKSEAGPEPTTKTRSEHKEHAFGLFRQGQSIDDVARQIARASSTVRGYLIEHIGADGVTDPTPWVDAATVEQIQEAAAVCDTDRLRPIYDFLQAQVPYDDIAITLTCQKNLHGAE